MGYIKLFNTNAAYQDYINGDPLLPNVSLVEENEGILFNPFVDYSKEYMYVKALEDGTSVSFTKKASSGSLYYSLDKQEWNKFTTSQTINSGEKVYFKGDLVPKLNNGIGTFTINKQCNVEGNVMSLLFADDFVGKTDLTGYNYAFYNLFKNCTTVQSAKNLILPATTLKIWCYQSMFQGCTSLTTAPELPATTLAGSCYQYMFRDCSSLTSAPELPATTLASSCYSSMFSGCTNLTIAPELPATTLAEYCYSYMFSGCTSLTSASTVLPATTLTTNCYQYMFNGCSSLTTAPELPATTLADYCYNGMFQGCSSLTTAPELPATTLATNCYNGMFSGTNVLPDCSNIDFSSSTVLASGGLRGLFAGTKITDNDLFDILPVNENGKYYLPATTLANYCYSNMFSGCTNLTSAPELPATTLKNYCYEYMFRGCTSLTSAPELPATTLTTYCYSSMFFACTNLNYIKMLATDISASRCLNSWVSNVSSTGTFVKSDGVEIPTGTSGIPEGWTVQVA